MSGIHWGNKQRACITCLVILAACENPGPESDPIHTRTGSAGRAAAATSDDAKFETRTNLTATADLPERSEATTDIAVRRAPPLGGAAMRCATDAAPQSGCAGAVAGLYGIALDLDVVWSDEVNTTTAAYAPGRGKISTLLIGELNGLCPGDTTGVLTVRVCDVRLPPIYVEANRGIIQLVIPHTTWERPDIPTYRSSVRMSRPDPTQLSIDPITALLGIELGSSDAPWPAYSDTPFITCASGSTGSDCFPDHDGDGEPGISLATALNGPPPSAANPRGKGWNYTPVPTDPSLPLLGVGATTLYAGLRARFGGEVPLGSDCNGGTSAAEAGDVSLRVFDCAMDDGSRCTPNGVTVVDQSMPVFHLLPVGEVPPRAWQDKTLDRGVSEGPRSTVLRLGNSGDELGCADVREAFAAR